MLLRGGTGQPQPNRILDVGFCMAESRSLGQVDYLARGWYPGMDTCC